jgi:SAM-dependent methyltransferase
MAADADLLIAGCGTGREAVLMSLTYPDARIVAIDISQPSLDYAAARCRAIGLERVEFRLLDLHKVGQLRRRFDFITCSGVLHHLPDPEAGWGALAASLKPGGVMQIMVYSKVARLRVRAARSLVRDLLSQKIDDDLIREVRKRLIAAGLLGHSRDFFSLQGTRDLVLHAHEDAFDVPRIAHALDRLGLELLKFELPTPADRAWYRHAHPDDPAFRDVAAWGSVEKDRPWIFSGMYKFFCRRPALDAHLTRASAQI